MSFKKLARWAGILLATALLTPTAVLIMLYTPFTQKRLTQWATIQLSHQTGIEIEIQELRLQFPLRIELKGVHIGQIADIRHVGTNIRLRPLLQGVIEADYISIQDVNICTDTLKGASISSQHVRADGISYDWHKRHAHLQRLYLANGNTILYEPTSPATKRTPLERLPISLTISNVKATHINTSYNTPEAKLQSSVEIITLHEVGADTAMNLSLQSAKIDGGDFMLHNPRIETHCSLISIQGDSLRYTPTGIEGQLTRLSFKESHGIDLQEGVASFTWHEGTMSLPRLMLRTPHSSLNGHLHISDHGTSDNAIDCSADMHIGYADAMLLTRWIGSVPKELASLYPTETLNASIAMNGNMRQMHLTRCDVSLPTAFDIGINGTMQDIGMPQRCMVQCHIEVKTHDLNFLSAFMENTAIRIPDDMILRGDINYAPDTLHAQCMLTTEEGTATLDAGYRPTSKAYTLLATTDSLDIRQIVPEGEFGRVSLQARLAGNGLDYKQDGTSIHGIVQLHHLQWREYTFSNASTQIIKSDKRWYAHASCNDTLMKWSLTSSITHDTDTIRTRFDARIDDLNLQALQITGTDIRPSIQCHATLTIDSGVSYSLRSRFSDIVLHTATQSIHPQPLELRGTLTADTILLDIRSGDLSLTTSAHTEGLPWQWGHSANISDHLTHLQAVLSAGGNNPISNYLSLVGIRYNTIHAIVAERRGAITSHLTVGGIIAKGFETDSIDIHADYTNGTLQAQVQSVELSWRTPQTLLQGKAEGTFTWGGSFAPDSAYGTLRLSSVVFALPAYSLRLHTVDTLSIPLERGTFTLNSIPLYTTSRQPLSVDGKIMPFTPTPTARLNLTARNTDILQTTPTREASLYGKAIVSGSIALEGPFNALSIMGNLQLRPGSSIYYIYKDAILTANNQLDNVVTFVSFDADTTSLPKPKRIANNLNMSVILSIDPTAQLEVSLGASKQNNVAIQGGGMLNLQYAPTMGVRLSGRYTIEQGTLNMNVPLLHVSSMAIRTGSTITWEGNPLNPLLNITAEDRVRASVTLDGSPQSVLFVAGVSLSDTMEKLNVQFTLTAPESASMQNTLATLSPDERGKLSVALLTTGLYLGEGGTGNLMNTALMGILQSQIDNISRDAFRTVDVSVGIEPLSDGVSGVSTRTDYSFSLSKRLWNNRIRIIIGGSVTTNNERIEDEAVIDNISIEWRITPVGNQYLRFFYDKNFESILEGEIRETGVGYAYRRKFLKREEGRGKREEGRVKREKGRVKREELRGKREEGRGKREKGRVKSEEL